MKKIDEDRFTTFVGGLALVFGTLGAFDVIPLQSAVFVCGICMQLISYYVKKAE